MPLDPFKCPLLNSCSKESTCFASSLRKNRDRVDTNKRQKIGSRFDGLVRDNNGEYEYAAIEGARSFGGVTCTKWLQDSRRVAKALHDMLSHLQDELSCQDIILGKLQVVGLVSAGK